MATLAKIVEALRRSAKNVRFADLAKVCDHYFGEPRQKGTSHRTYKTPWADTPRLNIQARDGEAKPYQVRQVLAAINRLENERENEKQR